MNIAIKTFALISATALSISTIQLSAQASAQAQGRWSGRGEIIKGNDKGTLVKLEVIVNNNVATIQTYPDQGMEIPLKRLMMTKTGNQWEIYPCQQNLCAILKQKEPSRTIYYRLYPNKSLQYHAQ